jgi:adenylate cyclase
VLYRFEGFELDLVQFTLRKDGDACALEPQVFDLLRALVDNRDRVMSKNALMEAVWPDRVVSEGNLAARMNTLRRSLGDSGEQQRFIRTVRGRGYQFVSDVEVIESASTPTSHPTPPRPDGRPTIVVLPFTSLSDEPNDEYLADGISEELITELSRFAELFVIAPPSSFAYRGKEPALSSLQAELGAGYVVRGTVRRSGTRIRVNVQLVETQTGTSIWAERFDREMACVFELEDEITKGVVGVLPGRVASHKTRDIARKLPEDLAAYELLLAGRVHHHRFTALDNARAFELIDRALELDPDYAAAWAWKACLLGQAIAREYLPEPVPVLIGRSTACVQRGLELDENEIECHRILGEIHLEARRWDEAAHHNGRALELNPNDPRLRAQKGELLTWCGDASEGADWIRSAMELDPYSAPSWAHLLGRALMQLGAYEEAVVAYRGRTYPRVGAHADLAACLTALHDMDAASREVERVIELLPSFSTSQYVDGLLYRDEGYYDRHRQLIAATSLPD